MVNDMSIEPNLSEYAIFVEKSIDLLEIFFFPSSDGSSISFARKALFTKKNVLNYILNLGKFYHLIDDSKNSF